VVPQSTVLAPSVTGVSTSVKIAVQQLTLVRTKHLAQIQGQSGWIYRSIVKERIPDTALICGEWAVQALVVYPDGVPKLGTCSITYRSLESANLN